MRGTLLLIGVAAGAVLGAMVAMSTVPETNCVPDDRMCTLQKLYLAQGVKVVGGMLAGYLVTSLLFVRAPDAVQDMQAARRRAAYRDGNRAAEAQAREQRLANTARLASLGAAPTGMPAAAMEALARRPMPQPPPAPPRAATIPPPKSAHAAPSWGAQRAAAAAAKRAPAVPPPTPEQQADLATLPPAALAALSRRAPAPARPPAPAPAPQAAGLPAAALAALARQPPVPGRRVGGLQASPAAKRA